MASFAAIIDGIRAGSVVPYLGAEALRGTTHGADGRPLPITGDELILALNRGRPMAPKLMYEFPRAAMHVELRRGRKAVDRFLQDLYGDEGWGRAPLHDWLRELKPAYVVDINRDTQLQDSYADTPHTLITGAARIGGTEFRFRLFHYDGSEYREIDQEAVDPALPILFKPLGTPRPQPTFIASDADFVDYITELMGGFAIPGFLKAKRTGLQYLFLGLRFTRDTERMVMSEITYGGGSPPGWALIPEPTDKERRFCERKGIEIIEADFSELVGSDAAVAAGA